MDERGASGARAIILERNKLVSRKLVRFFTCAGFDPIPLDNPHDVKKHLPGSYLLGADAFDVELVVEALRNNPTLRVVLWTAEPLQRSLHYMVENPNISNVLGRADFDSPPRGWELMLVLRRLLRPREEGPKFAWYLDWGFTGFQERVIDTVGRDRLVEKVQKFVHHLGVRERVGELFSELAHELLMNAMFDAPVDERGQPKYALDRKASLVLAEHEQPSLRLASDGSRLAIQVTDGFGRLERGHVFEGLQRGLNGGQMDQSRGGAGLGMVVCHNCTVAMFFDVVRHRKTEVTGIFDLDLGQREFRAQAKSLHYFEM
ncbi:MAG TPA: hypothetical protein VKB80_29375 [Kofleriaceae bacterium]|nr:hypothetical protein [Kofleriaceae bacterium]